ncbi:MAG: sigma-54-dependent Fis family transcriptional regulator [Planctomycetia bacterium]|nr:sigma-54-dependent Fis family transcriptional regulator [Planctomycetia bacterium]
MPKVLAIDDDRAVLRLVRKSLDSLNVKVVTAESAQAGLAKLKSEEPDVLLLDIMLPDTSGIELAKEIRAIDAKLPVIFITVSDDSSVAIEAMKLGAYEYVLKPLGVQQIQELVERALETRRLMRAPVHLPENGDRLVDGDVLIGRSAPMLEVYKQIGRVAAQDVSVLIRGESGTGKELIARAIYQHSHRKDNCFLAVNCAALSDTLLESELFGHEKGSFTSAHKQRLGKFEQATNRDLEQMIVDNEFRLDLLHRLNAFEIYLPPLRERGDDLRLLIEHFVAQFNRQLGKHVTGISDEAMALLTAYHWPGNIRELQGALRKAMLMATGPVLIPKCFSIEITNSADKSGAPLGAWSEDADFASFLNQREQTGSNNLYAESLEWMERLLLPRILETHGCNQSKAAERLGITRGSLRHKIKALSIQINHVVSAEDDDENAG